MRAAPADDGGCSLLWHQTLVLQLPHANLEDPWQARLLSIPLAGPWDGDPQNVQPHGLASVSL